MARSRANGFDWALPNFVAFSRNPRLHCKPISVTRWDGWPPLSCMKTFDQTPVPLLLEPQDQPVMIAEQVRGMGIAELFHDGRGIADVGKQDRLEPRCRGAVCRVRWRRFVLAHVRADAATSRHCARLPP